MAVLANASFDYIAITRGFTVLIFCIPIVILSEYAVYRVMNPKQSICLTVIACIYANVISAIAGIFWANEGTLDLHLRTIIRLFSAGYDEETIVSQWMIFGYLFLLTCAIELIAVFVFRRKLNFKKLFSTIILANVVSYAATMLILLMCATH